MADFKAQTPIARLNPNGYYVKVINAIAILVARAEYTQLMAIIQRLIVREQDLIKQLLEEYKELQVRPNINSDLDIPNPKAAESNRSILDLLSTGKEAVQAAIKAVQNALNNVAQKQQQVTAKKATLTQQIAQAIQTLQQLVQQRTAIASQRIPFAFNPQYLLAALRYHAKFAADNPELVEIIRHQQFDPTGPTIVSKDDPAYANASAPLDSAYDNASAPPLDDKNLSIDGDMSQAERDASADDLQSVYSGNTDSLMEAIKQLKLNKGSYAHTQSAQEKDMAELETLIEEEQLLAELNTYIKELLKAFGDVDSLIHGMKNFASNKVFPTHYTDVETLAKTINDYHGQEVLFKYTALRMEPAPYSNAKRSAQEELEELKKAGFSTHEAQQVLKKYGM